MGVMPQPRHQPPVQPRLIRINLPGVDVSDHRKPFTLSAMQPQPCVPPGKQSQISATSKRKVELTPKAESGDGILQQGAGGRIDAKGKSRRIRYAIAIMANGINAGIVGKSEFSQNIRCPQ